MKIKAIIPDPTPTGIELSLSLREYVLMCVTLYGSLNGYTDTFVSVRTNLESIRQEWGNVFPEDRKGFVHRYNDAARINTCVARAEAICDGLGI